jgi:hypothetical protein
MFTVVNSDSRLSMFTVATQKASHTRMEFPPEREKKKHHTTYEHDFRCELIQYFTDLKQELTFTEIIFPSNCLDD